MEHEQYQHDPQPEQQQDFISTPNVARTDKDLVIKNLFSFTDTEFSQLRGQRFKRTIFSGSVYSATTSDYLIGVTNLGVAPTIGLPPARLVGVGKTYVVKDEVGGCLSTNATVVAQDGGLIDGSTTRLLNINYDSWRFYSDGNKWFTSY